MIYYVGKNPKITIQQASTQDVIDFLETVHELYIDTETTALHPQLGELLLLQLGNSEKQFVIDAKTEDLLVYKRYIETIPIVGHNLKFDLRFLYNIGIYPYINCHDTYLRELILTSGISRKGRSLQLLISKYCKVQISKGARQKFVKGIIDDTAITYAGNDVKYLPRIFEEQEKEIRRNRLQNCYEEERLFLPVMAYTEDCGMFVDKNKLTEKIAIDVKNLNAALDRLDDLYYKYSSAPQTSLFGGAPINWNSPNQLLPFLKSLGIDIRDENGKLSSSKKVIGKLRGKHEVVDALLDFKYHGKRCSTYGKNILDLYEIFPDHRIRTSFRQIVKTGRMGSGKDEEEGGNEINLQNIPGDEISRGIFIPEEGKVFVVGDYSQQEQNILANQSQNEALLNFFKGQQSDIHCFVVRNMFPECADLTDKEIKENHADKRHLAKICGFATNYGGSAHTVAKNLGLSEEEAARIYESYVNALPGLFDYFDQKERETLKNGYILTNQFIKRRIFIPEFAEFKRLGKEIDWDEYRIEKELQSEKYFEEILPKVRRRRKIKAKIRRASMNQPVQSTGADMMKQAGIKLFHWIIENNHLYVIKIVNIVHDEFVLETPEELKEIASEKLIESMQEGSQYFCDTVPIRQSVKTSHQWAH